MPIYEYICSKCEQKFELLKAMSQAGESVPCPSCGGKAERVLSRFCSHADESLDFPGSGGGSACSSCSSDSCSTCSL
jgi:putative FmdB family regulatory protein